MTINSFGKLKRVCVGDFPDHKYMKQHYEEKHKLKAFPAFKKIATETKQDLDTLAEVYQDYGVEVLRPVMNPFMLDRWSKITYKPPHVLENKFFVYKNLTFFTTTAEDDCIPYYEFCRHVLEHEHDRGQMIFCNPLTLETEKMESYEDSDWPGDQGFLLDAPTMIPMNNTIIYNREYCNTDRAIEWIERIVTTIYPDTKFVDMSDFCVNHIDNQIRIYNEKLAHITLDDDTQIKEILRSEYPGIEILNWSRHKKVRDEFKSSTWNEKEELRELTWIKKWVDDDIENGSTYTSSVSIDPNTVVALKNNLGSCDELRSKGLKVEEIELRHSDFWGAGIDCETAILERDID